MDPSSQPKKQRALLARWLLQLEAIPEIDVVWLDGSLANDANANPASDIDIRVAIRDEDFDRVWVDDPGKLLGGLGRRIALDGNWRHLTWEGILVEINVFKTSQISGMAFPDWEILFSRLRESDFAFERLPERPPSEVWPETDELTIELVERWTKVFLLAMSHAPSVLYRGEVLASRLQLDWMREELLKMMYRHLDLASGVRPRHLSTIFPPETVSHLASTYLKDDQSIADTGAVVRATLRTLGLIGTYLEKLDKRAGGGFEPDWYRRMLGLLEEELSRF